MGHTFPLVDKLSFRKSIKCSISAYMIFVKETNVTNSVSNISSDLKEESNYVRFLSQYKDLFIEDIPSKLPSSRGEGDHRIDLVLGSSPPNRPPYRVSLVQQEEIMRQVNEIIEKRMARA